SAIKNWLFEFAEYSLDAGEIPAETDLTAYFLETGEGYCVHFATAMTVLARSAGLPARYVQGFALLETAYGGEHRYRATGKTAHAWSELYFEGIGWVEFDPLSGYGSALQQSADWIDTAPVERPSQRPSPPADPSAQVDERDDRGVVRRAAPPETLLLLLILPLLCAAYLLALRLGPKRMRKKWSLTVLRKRFAEPQKQLDALYNDLLELLALHAVTAQPLDTLITFSRRVDRLFAFDSVTMAEIGEMMMDSHFGGLAPEDGDVARASTYHVQMEALTYEALGKRRYLFKRVLKPRVKHRAKE
ncbi:MAG: transglutaminase-like domain-containing protein, partial [Defluviitaleaceae bacterium]|nr:transglutaminase-like domain-containing protein [Defluviitaleaceae bacterium]